MFFFSSKDLNRPGELFNSSLDSFTYYEKDLFEATSSVDSESIFFLRNKNLTIPDESFKGSDVDKNFIKLNIEDKELCPCFATRFVKNVKILINGKKPKKNLKIG